MSVPGTVPIRTAGIPLRQLRVEVIAGPDAGLTRTAEGSITVGTGLGNALELTDRTISRFHLELIRSGDAVRVVDHGSTNGTAIAGVRIQHGAAVVRVGATIELGQTQLRLHDGEVVLADPGPSQLGGMLARSTVMRALMATVERVAASEVSVLVTGESGTGKELIGRALHDLSRRKTQPFVVVDCGAMSPSLFASELFGHERGAFTGAHRRHLGAFERASGGTVFLDEIGELPPEMQSALLGVLERRTVRRVGGSEDVRVDVRVLAATSRDLRREVNLDQFRLDLYYRLAVVALSVPPLRERPADIPTLIDHFLREGGHDGPVESVFSSEAMQRLVVHAWPGNVRELRNTVLGTLALGRAVELEPSPAMATASSADLGAFFDRLPLGYNEARQAVTDAFEKHHLARLLQATGGNVREAARQGRMNRSYLTELLKRHGLR